MSEELTRTTVTLPKGLKRNARLKALSEDTNLSEVVRELLTMWIKEDREQPRPAGESPAARGGRR